MKKPKLFALSSFDNCDVEPSQLAIRLLEKELLPRLQSGEETHLVVAHKRPKIVTLPAFPGTVSRANFSRPPLIRKPNALRDSWHKDALLGFAYVIRGEADLLFSRRVVTCYAGNFVFFLPHTWRNLGAVSHWERPGTPQANCELLWFYLSPHEVFGHACWSRGAEHFASRHLFFSDHRLPFLAELLQEEVFQDEVSPAATQLLWLVYERIRRKLQQGNFLTDRMTAQELPLSSKPTASIGQRAQDYVDANLMEQMTLESVARAIFTSRARLSHQFREHTGETFGVYLLRRRLERAQHLLASTSDPIKNIAWRVGFSDPDYFSAAFRRAIGNTPTEFRNRKRR